MNDAITATFAVEVTLATAGLGDAVLAETGSVYWAAGASGWANGMAMNALGQLRGNGGNLQCIDPMAAAEAGAMGAVSSVAFAGVLNGVGNALSKASSPPASPFPAPDGALTPAEEQEIQGIADEFGTDIDVVGSRAAGNGRNIGTDLPVGKGPNTRSDIDFRISGEADISSGGALSSRLQNVGNGAGSVMSSGLPKNTIQTAIHPFFA